MIQARPATEATPVPLSSVAAAEPATAVPWPCTSRVSVLLSWKLRPATMRSFRSGCVPSTPVSRMATVTPLPVVLAHAAAAPIFDRCHWLPR